MKTSTSPTSTLIYMLAALTALTPLAVDAYLPAMPNMAAFFNTDIHAIELSLSVFLVGFSLGQLFGGPFSDHFGRRTATGTGLALFCLGSLGIILSGNIILLWTFRALQALGGGLAVVNSAAIIRDLSHGNDSAKHLSHIAVIMMTAPLLAPLIGMMLLHLSGWHLIFIFLLAYGLTIGVTTFFKLPETRRHSKEKQTVFDRYWQVLRHRVALSFIISQCFALAGMFAFITGSPVVYMSYFGVSETVYPFLFGANIIGMILANRLNMKLLSKYESKQVLWFGQGLQLLTGFILLAYVSLFNTLQLSIVVPLIIIFIACMGLVAANATSGTVEFFPYNAATATALIGAMGFAAGSISAGIVGLLGDGSPYPMILVMSCCALFGPLSRFLILSSSHKSSAE